jgi:phosphotriesterase-related protein
MASQSRQLVTVSGPLDPNKAGVADAHDDVWIRAVPGVPVDSPLLQQRGAITAELIDYRNAGGNTIVDCQPGTGCGRDGAVGLELAAASGVNIVASTGFHLPRYYPPDYWLFGATCGQAYDHFRGELTKGLEETRNAERPDLAGVVKIACQESVLRSPVGLMEAAAATSRDTGAAVLVHTERGADAEEIVQTLLRFEMDPLKLVLCHMDKRPDFALHENLARAGVMLEYDTFNRPKYAPERNVWPLLRKMADAGLVNRVALAADIADQAMWSRMGGGPGLVGFVALRTRLEREGFSEEDVRRLLGRNVVERLARVLA